MLAEAMLIIDSVGFLEKQIHQILGELQEAVNNRYYEDADRIEYQIHLLIKKTDDENLNMDRFMAKYKEKINEKKTILSTAQQKKQTHYGCISTNQNWQRRRAPLQAKT